MQKSGLNQIKLQPSYNTKNSNKSYRKQHVHKEY